MIIDVHTHLNNYDETQVVPELEYLRLCDNLHPVTGDRLTVRQRTAV